MSFDDAQVVLAWTLTNGALVAAILSTSAGDTLTTTRTNVYMAFLLYSVAGLAAFRFVGSTVYSIFWLFQVSGYRSFMLLFSSKSVLMSLRQSSTELIRLQAHTHDSPSISRHFDFSLHLTNLLRCMTSIARKPFYSTHNDNIPLPLYNRSTLFNFRVGIVGSFSLLNRHFLPYSLSLCLCLSTILFGA